MRNPGGYAVLVSPRGQTVDFDGLRREQVQAGTLERDTFTCFHCNAVEHTPARPGPNDVGFCRNCMQRICQRCAALPCVPFEKRLIALEQGIKEALDRDWGR
jgi:hypothetical protein